jgi:hypothetical protein
MEDAASWYVPAPQGLQTVSEVWDSPASEYLPAAHALHCVDASAFS